MMTDYEYEKLSEILAEKNEHYSIAFTEQSISVYYNRCRLFELILDEINNPRFLFDGMQQINCVRKWRMNNKQKSKLFYFLPISRTSVLKKVMKCGK